MMWTKLMLLAQGAAPLVAPVNEKPSLVYGWSMRDLLLVLGAVAVLVNVLVLLVYFTRRNRHNEYGNYSRALAKAQHSHSGHRRRHRKRKHSHPDNLPRNPTLAEAGGLPPVRPDDPPRSAH
ncbi:MAG TPA: hypothetical protein VNZ22_00405 [Bacillota bacterium]|nr:hypothetical protein [Bacillota bacterium]